VFVVLCVWTVNRGLRLKCDGTRAKTRFRLSATRTSPFKTAGASVQSTTGSRAVHIGVIKSSSSCSGRIRFDSCSLYPQN